MNLYLKSFGAFCKKTNFHDNFKHKSWFDINHKLLILFKKISSHILSQYYLHHLHRVNLNSF